MKRITNKKLLTLYGCSGMGVNMLNLIVGSYLCSALLVGGFEEHVESWTYLNKDLVVAGLWAPFVFLAKALDGIIDLPLASFADRLNTKLGRRKTAILMGFVPMVIAYLLFLLPIHPGESYANTIWFGVLLCVFYACYTLTMLTFYATFSEVCASEQDTVYLSNIKSICDVVYFILGFALIPVLVNMDMNIRIVALIFLPLSLTMMIPMLLLKETKNGESKVNEDALTLGKALRCSFQNKNYIYWMCTTSVLTIGLQLFLGGINEVFSSIGLNQTVVMASSFAPVPFTIFLYNYLVKRKGLAFGYRYILIVFSIGMITMYLCSLLTGVLSPFALTMIAVVGGLFVSFAVGSFFSVSYTIPTFLAQQEFEKTGKSVATMYFAVQGVFEGIASGIGTGFILVALKDRDCIELLPLVVVLTCAGAFAMSFGFPKGIALLGKKEKE